MNLSKINYRLMENYEPLIDFEESLKQNSIYDTDSILEEIRNKILFSGKRRGKTLLYKYQEHEKEDIYLDDKNPFKSDSSIKKYEHEKEIFPKEIERFDFSEKNEIFKKKLASVNSTYSDDYEKCSFDSSSRSIKSGKRRARDKSKTFTSQSDDFFTDSEITNESSKLSENLDSVNHETIFNYSELASNKYTNSNGFQLYKDKKNMNNSVYSRENLVYSDVAESLIHKCFQDFDFTRDEFTICQKCGTSLIKKQFKLCCLAYIERISYISSNIEKSFWISFIIDPCKTIFELPNYTVFLFFQQGIPCQLRSLIWKKLFYMNMIYEYNDYRLLFNNFQHSYNARISKQISKDLKRTFSTVTFFKNKVTINGLLTILNVYANYDHTLGYCQGLLFLVGVLYYHFQRNCEFTFCVLVSIMDYEHELHDIFSSLKMSTTLEKWYNQFLCILKIVDRELFDHLTSFVDLKVFLYQWWLTFCSINCPDLSIISRIMDFSIIHGWKKSLMKISLGLLIINKPILMNLNQSDEEVVYQHLLNETKWGNAIKHLDLFFGDLLLSWDEKTFTKIISETSFYTLLTNKGNSQFFNAMKKISSGFNFKRFSTSESALSFLPEKSQSNSKDTRSKNFSFLSSNPNFISLKNFLRKKNSSSNIIKDDFHISNSKLSFDHLSLFNSNINKNELAVLESSLENFFSLIGDEPSDTKILLVKEFLRRLLCSLNESSTSETYIRQQLIYCI